jgi:hypothetical protein
MSKKSSTFAPDMKKMYHIPSTEIMTLETKRMMQQATISDHSDPGMHAPAHHGLGGASPF